MSHVIGKSKAELLAMARSHQEGKKGTTSLSLSNRFLQLQTCS